MIRSDRHIRRLTLLVICLLASTGVAQTSIEFWHSQGITQDLIQVIADEFNASQSDYIVIPRFTGGYQESAIKLIAALNVNEAPVLFEAELSVFAKFAEEAALEDMKAYANSLESSIVDDFFPQFWSFGYLAEQRLGLPWNFSLPVIYYNKTLFEQLQVTPPQSWQEFEAAAERLSTRNTQGYVDVAAAFIFETLVTTSGGSLLDDAGQVRFDSPEAIEALTMLQRMAKDKTSIPRGFAELDQALIDFARTKVLMAIASEAFFPQGERFAVAFEVASTPIPNYQLGVPLLGSQLVVIRGCTPEEADAAFAFWQYLTEPSTIARWVKRSHFLPIRQSALPLLEDWYSEDSSRRSGLTQLEYAISQPKVSDYVVWQGYLEEAIEHATKAGMDPAEALKQAQRRVEESR